jgi:hypothetical protein
MWINFSEKDLSISFTVLEKFEKKLRKRVAVSLETR